MFYTFSNISKRSKEELFIYCKHCCSCAGYCKEREGKVLDDMGIELDLTDADVDRLIRKDKGLAFAMVNNTAAPMMGFLKAVLSLSNAELKKIVLSHPPRA